MHGQEKYSYEDGSFFEGSFKHIDFNGDGLYIYSSGALYRGGLMGSEKPG